jgi:hypothetical protein
MEEFSMPQISLETRLSALNLKAAAVNPTDLNVPANQQVVIDINNKTYAKNLTYLTPQTLDDVKQWLGIPDSAFAQAPVVGKTIQPRMVVAPTRVANPTVLPQIALQPGVEHSPADIAQLHSLASDYVYGNSVHVSASQIPALNAWIVAQKIKIPIFVFANINVAAGATLQVNVATLFAHYITVEHTGKIKLRGGSKTVIHAAGFTGKGIKIPVGRAGSTVTNRVGG